LVGFHSKIRCKSSGLTSNVPAVEFDDELIASKLGVVGQKMVGTELDKKMPRVGHWAEEVGQQQEMLVQQRV